MSVGGCEGGNRVLNRSVWFSLAFDAGSGSEPAISPSAVEDVEGTSPKNDEIVESNRSAIGLVWLGSAATYVGAAFGLVWAAPVDKVGTESVVVSPAPIVAV